MCARVRVFYLSTYLCCYSMILDEKRESFVNYFCPKEEHAGCAVCEYKSGIGIDYCMHFIFYWSILTHPGGILLSNPDSI